MLIYDTAYDTRSIALHFLMVEESMFSGRHGPLLRRWFAAIATRDVAAALPGDDPHKPYLLAAALADCEAGAAAWEAAVFFCGGTRDDCDDRDWPPVECSVLPS